MTRSFLVKLSRVLLLLDARYLPIILFQRITMMNGKSVR